MELGIGIFGYGFMGRAHTYALTTIPLYYEPLPFRIKHISICTPSESGRKAAEATGYYRRVTEDFRALVEDPEINVVCIASPNGFHKEQLIAAIEAGKHIYCEKPVVVSMAEAREVLDVMRRTGYRGKNQTAFEFRFFPATMRAKQLVEEGFLGPIFHYRASYLHSSNIDANKPIQWKSDRSRGGGGAFFDMGVHLCDLMCHLLGDLESVHALGRTFIKERPSPTGGHMVPVDTDDATMMLLRHKSGVAGVMDVSKVACGTCDELRFEIHGQHGAIRFNMMDPNWLEVFDARDSATPLGGQRGFKKVQCVQQYPKPGGSFPNPKFSVGLLRGHVHSVYTLLENIALDGAPSPSILDGIRMQQVLAAVYESAEKGNWVTVEEPLA